MVEDTLKKKILELKTPVNIHENSKPNTHVNILHATKRGVGVQTLDKQLRCPGIEI